MIEQLIDNVLTRSRTVLTIMAFAIFAGVIAYVAIPKEADPDVPIPVVLVQVAFPGISPEDAERLLIRPLETELQSIEGLEEMVSSAVEGLAYMVLEFDVNFDQDQAMIDVREKVDRARAEFPDGTEEPVIEELNASLFPVVIIGLGGNIPERELYRIGERLQDRLEAIPEVLSADLNGNRDEMLEVIVNPSKLQTYNITQDELISAVTQNNRLVSSGAIDTGKGRFAVKVPGTFESAEDVDNLVIKAAGEGTVTLSDVADIRRTFKDRTQFTAFNGKPGISLEVVKRIGANIIETNNKVRAVVAEEQARWPQGMEVSFIFDQSKFIYSIIGQLQASILTAVSVVMIIVVAALGLRSGLMVGVSIPTSFLLAFLVIFAMGDSINMMVMFGMVIAVGILVDASIVMIEYADRKMTEGFDRREAYGLAAKRMFWPILSSTLTTLAAFLPLLFWPGVMGKFMSILPQSLIIVLVASFFVAILFLPVLGSVIGQSNRKNPEQMKALAGTASQEDLNALRGATRWYLDLLHRSLRHPLTVLGAVVLLVFSVFIVFGRANVDTVLFADEEPDQFVIFVGAIGNLSAVEAGVLVAEVDREIRKLPGLAAVQTTIGTGQQRFSGFDDPPPDDSIGSINVELKEWKDRRIPADEIIARARETVSGFPGLRIEIREREMGPPVGKDVQIELRSHNGEKLLAETVKIRNHFDQDEDLIDVEDTRSLPGIEWVLSVDRELAGRFGADVSQVGAVVQLVTNGLLIGEYRPDDAIEEVEIRVRYPYEDRLISQLDSLRIQTPQGPIPISNMVTREPRDKVSKIDRLDGQRVYRIRANTGTEILPSGERKKINVDKKVAEIEQWVKTQANLHPAVTYRFRGANEETEDLGEFFFWALISMLFLMGIILLTQFNNFYYVLITLSSIFLSTAGVFIGVLVTGQVYSSVMSGIGIIALAGIVVNNNIVLIDTFQRFSASGNTVYEAVIRTAAQRVRPVLLTTVTTICGLIPMMYMVNLNFFERAVSVGGPAAAWWVPLSTAVVFGLGFSTLITLVLTPCLLYLPYHVREQVSGAMQRLGLRKQETKGPASAPAE